MSLSKAQVLNLQKDLNKLIDSGYIEPPRLAEDGIMGNGTKKAIKDVQAKAGISVDGIYGPQTQRAIDSALAGNSVAVESNQNNTSSFGTMKVPKLNTNGKLLYDAAIAVGIRSKNEMAMFLGQLHHESGGFTRIEESFNYKPERLFEVFGPKRVTSVADAQQLLAQGPQAVAERVYGNRSDLGNTTPGDGWKYHGRGFIQLTGKYNYDKFGKICGYDIVNNPDQLANVTKAVEISIAFWFKSNGLRAAGQSGNVESATKIINGGTNGLSDRRTQYNNFLKQL